MFISFLIIFLIFIVSLTFLLFFIIKKKSLKNSKCFNYMDKIKIKKAISTLNLKVEDLNKNYTFSLLKILDSCVQNISTKVCFEYSKFISSEDDNKKLYLIQDVLELYLLNDLPKIILPKLLYFLNTNSIDKLEMTESLEDFVKEIFDASSLGVSKYTSIIDLVPEINVVFEQSLKLTLDNIRLSINKIVDLQKEKEYNLKKAEGQFIKGLNRALYNQI